MKNYKSSLTLARAAMTLLLALLTATTAWAQDDITGLTYNDGGYYEISDAQDLVDLANYVNGGNNASDKTFKQTQDIDMSSAGNFEPIGSQPNSYSPTPFNGTYDGQGHAIIGLTVNTSSPYAGLFGLFQGGSVRNVTMVNPNVTSNCNSFGGKYAGGIVGAIQPGTIENCNVINPTLNPGRADKGAICGTIADIEATVTNCYYYTTTNYNAVGNNAVVLAYSASRTYTLTLADGITTSTAAAFTYNSTDYYAGTITLPAAPIGWVYTYTVNGSAIDGNTFDISADASVTVNKHISSLLGYDDDPLVDGSAEHPYIISTAEGWNLFCDCLNDNDTWNRFSGKTVKLGDDIGSAENPVTRMAGSDSHQFTGTFDGGGNTLTVNYANTGNSTMTAPFSYVDGATIQNLIVGGTISGTAYRAAGIIGETVNATSHITNCVSSVDISSGRYTGGFSIGGNVEIEGCMFNGKINGTANSGGFIGYSNSAQVIKNSLFAPQDGSSINGGTFYFNGVVDVAPVNSYYTQALGTAQGKATRTVSAGENVTIEAVALTGTATQYNVSGIVAYSSGGLYRDGNLYYGSGDQLSLTLSNTATAAPQGYQYGYTASAGTLDGTTLTMPDEDVTISVNTDALALIDWATVSDGDSEEDPYMIYNKDQLLLLAHRVNGTNGETANDYKGKYFKLGADITFTHDDNEGDDYEENYEAIGNGSHYFKGNFDGDNHTVSGIRIRKTGAGIANNYIGLFGQTGSANIHDVHLTDARIKGYCYVGGIVGYNSNRTTVSGCTVTDSYITATGGTGYGTICGQNATGFYGGTLTNNYYHGCTVNGTAVTSGMGCGGSDLNDEDNNNGALPAYAITLGDGVSTTALASAPENGFVYNGVSYYRDGLALPLASTLGSEVPEGYTLSFSANGTALSGNTYTVNSTDGDVTITAAIRSDGQQHEVSYVDADGTTQTASAIALDGTETTLAAGWYFVGKDIDYTATITLGGDVNLILADGCEMNIGSSGSRINGNGIARESLGDQALTIYGQTAGTGTLSIYTDNDNNNGIVAKAVTINGGNVTIDANGKWSTGIYAGVGNIIINSGNVNVTGDNTWGLYAQGNVNVNGGNVNATGGSSGIRTDYGSITLGYTNPTDYILSSGYETDGTAKVADGLCLTDGTFTYSGTLTDKQLAAIANQKLTPAYVINGNSNEAVSFTEQKEHATVIYDRKFTKGVTSTIVLPFDFDATALDGALHTILSIDVQDGKWVAKASDAITVGKANTPYLFKPNSDIVSTTFKDVTIALTEGKAITIGKSKWQMKGVYQFKEWDADSPTDYGFAGAAQETTEGEAIKAGDFVRVGSGAKIRATRCYLTYAYGISKASPILPDRITVIFPDATASVIEPQPADPSGDTDPSGDITTPISEIAAQSGTKVWGYDGTIYIESQPYTPYTMIDIAGRTLKNGVTNSTREEVTLSRPAGIVIVRIGGKTFKIFNR